MTGIPTWYLLAEFISLFHSPSPLEFLALGEDYLCHFAVVMTTMAAQTFKTIFSQYLWHSAIFTKTLVTKLHQSSPLNYFDSFPKTKLWNIKKLCKVRSPPFIKLLTIKKKIKYFFRFCIKMESEIDVFIVNLFGQIWLNRFLIVSNPVRNCQWKLSVFFFLDFGSKFLWLERVQQQQQYVQVDLSSRVATTQCPIIITSSSIITAFEKSTQQQRHIWQNWVWQCLLFSNLPNRKFRWKIMPLIVNLLWIIRFFLYAVREIKKIIHFFLNCWSHWEQITMKHQTEKQKVNNRPSDLLTQEENELVFNLLGRPCKVWVI